MIGFINGVDWINVEAMKYWSFGSNYQKDIKSEVKNLIFSGKYIGALKMDGYYQRLIKDEDGNCFMIARNKNVNGEAINKIDWVPQIQKFMKKIPNGTVFLCECYLPSNPGSKNITSLLGCLKDKCLARQKAAEPLNFYIFDICAYNEVNFIDTSIEERVNLLKEYSKIYIDPFVKFATYYEGQELWDKIGEYLENGEEGVVISRKDCPIYFKRTPARMTIKVKKEIKNTIDCFFTGNISMPTRRYEGKNLEEWTYWVDLRNEEKIEKQLFSNYLNGESLEPVTKGFFNGWAGSLEIGVLKDNKVAPIGYLSGLSDEIKSDWKKYKGRIIEVSAMEVLPETHGLRHAKIVGFRDDLTIKDCQWEKIFG